MLRSYVYSTLGCKLFELDYPDVLDYKDSILVKAGALPRCDRKTIPGDLASPQWPEKLIEAGFDKTKPSVFLMEGLLGYLDPESVDRLMKTVVELCDPHSVLVGIIATDLLTINTTLSSEPYIQTS